MSHFARIDSNNIVQQVIVVEQDVIDSGVLGDPATWIRTSYNTERGVHKLGGTPLRKNFAGVGYKYDSYLDAFIPPAPLIPGTWKFDEFECNWVRPVPYPNDGKYYTWDLATDNWIEIPEPFTQG